MSEEQNNNLVQNPAKTELEKAPTAVENKEEETKKAEDKVVIHTMPKRFYSSNAGYDKSKKVGVIIMSIGVVFLLLIAVFLYFFFIRSTDENIEVPAVQKTEGTEVVDSVATDKIEEEANEVKEVEDKVAPEESEEIIEEEVEESTEEEIIEEELEEEIIEEATSTEEIIEEDTTIKEATDTDRDGLTNSEEAIFGSIVNLKDSDGDGYDDLSEVLSMYNPAGEGSIIVNSGIEKYTNLKNSYSLYYPKVATYDKVGGSEDSMMFKFTNGHIIQVIVAPNSEKLSIEEWYKKQFDVSVVRNDQRVYKTGWTGVRSEDGLVVYLANPSSSDIYTLAYNITVDYTLTYKNIFELMINSLELK